VVAKLKLKNTRQSEAVRDLLSGLTEFLLN